MIQQSLLQFYNAQEQPGEAMHRLFGDITTCGLNPGIFLFLQGGRASSITLILTGFGLKRGNIYMGGGGGERQRCPQITGLGAMILNA